MSNPLDTKSKVDRACRAFPHCAASAALLDTPSVVLGVPDSSFTLECEICQIYVCGGCARRDMVSVRISDYRFFAWSFRCPRCDSPIGRRLKARLLSMRTGDLGELQHEGDELIGNAASAANVEASVTHHRTTAHIHLRLFNTAPTLNGAIHEVESATVEYPGEPLVWLYKAALCDHAGYTVAAEVAMRLFQRVRAACGADPVIGVVSADSAVRMAVEELRRAALATSMALSRRRSTLSNRELTFFDQQIDFYHRDVLTLPDFLEFLFPEPQVAPQEIRDLFEAIRLEKSIDFVAVEAERTKIIESYAAQVEEQTMQRLLGRSLAFRMGSISTTDFYAELFETVEASGLDLRMYPHVQSYRRYCELVVSVDPVRLHGLIWQEVIRKYERLARTPEERHLTGETIRHYLVERLLQYLDGKLGVARLQSTYASQPRAVHDLAKSLSSQETSQKAPLWKCISGSSWWKRFFGG